MTIGNLSPGETARYTRDLLESLWRLAKHHREPQLALLIKAAAIEARRVAERSADGGVDQA